MAATASSAVVTGTAAAAAESRSDDQPLRELSSANGNVEEVEEQVVPKANAAGPQVDEAAGTSQSSMKAQRNADKPVALFAKTGHEVTSVVASGQSDDEEDNAVRTSSTTGSHMMSSTPYEELD